MNVEGHVEGGFEPVAAALGRQVERIGGGAAACVYFRGRPVVDVWAGERAPGIPWQADTPALSFSTSKGVTATALHRLADRGLVDYDLPIARYWPEFAQGGKGSITLRHVLSHRAGLYDLRHLIDHGERMLDWRYMVHALERARPAHEPGAYPAYHGLTYGWLVGEVVERVSGLRFADFVQREVVDPLGLDGMWIGAPAEARARAAELAPPIRRHLQIERMRAPARAIRTLSRWLGFPIDLSFLRDALLVKQGGEVFWHPSILVEPIPAANGLFTARALARLYAALADGGSLDAVRLLSEETVRAATTVQTRQRDRVILFRPGWRLGYHGAFTTRGALKGGFGHFGFGGSGAWADPKRRLALGFVNNRAGGTPLGDLRVAQIGTAVIGCVKRIAGEAAVAA
jgi:CubicO group peptidase (beta-lactamase class C family)